MPCCHGTRLLLCKNVVPWCLLSYKYCILYEQGHFDVLSQDKAVPQRELCSVVSLEQEIFCLVFSPWTRQVQPENVVSWYPLTLNLDFITCCHGTRLIMRENVVPWYHLTAKQDLMTCCHEARLFSCPRMLSRGSS